MKLHLDDGDEHVDADGAPDLRLYRVLVGTLELEVGTPKGAHTLLAMMALDDSAKWFPRHKLHDLCELCFAHIHA